MSKNKVTHFEIPASDFEKAKAFYAKIFDWKFEMWGDEGMMTTTVESDKNGPKEPGGINGGFYKRTSAGEQPSFVVETDSIDETLKLVEQVGGKVTTPKHPIGEWGYMADFADPEGNELSLWEDAKR